MIPFRVKQLTETAKLPEQSNPGDLYDLFADSFCVSNLKDTSLKEEGLDDLLTAYTKTGYDENTLVIFPQGRALVKTGIALDLPKQYDNKWFFEDEPIIHISKSTNPYIKPDPLEVEAYAVADIRPRSGLALKHGLTVLNTPGTIDNSYRKEIGVIMINNGHEPYIIEKGDKIAQMLIRPLYPSKMEIVSSLMDTGRGGFGSTGK